MAVTVSVKVVVDVSVVKTSGMTLVEVVVEVSVKSLVTVVVVRTVLVLGVTK